MAEKIGIPNDEIADALEKSSNELIELMEESSKLSDGFDASGFRRSVDFHVKFIRFSDKENQGNVDG